MNLFGLKKLIVYQAEPTQSLQQDLKQPKALWQTTLQGKESYHASYSPNDQKGSDRRVRQQNQTTYNRLRLHRPIYGE